MDGQLTKIACRYCMAPNHPLRPRCHECGTPIGPPSEAAAAYERMRHNIMQPRAADTTAEMLERFLPDVTLIGPTAGEQLRQLVYGGAA